MSMELEETANPVVEAPPPEVAIADAESGQLDDQASGGRDATDATALQRRSQLEAALRGLKDGTLSEQEAAQVLDGLMKTQIDDLRAELTSPATGIALLNSVIKTAVAHLTETPTNC
jgi:hypothetical protein